MEYVDHTPGPWEVREDNHELQVIAHTENPHYPNPSRSDGLWPVKLMLIKPHRTGARRGCGIHYLPFTDKEKADMQLAASAPQMKEALLHCLRTLNLINKAFLHGRSVPYLDNAGNVVREKGTVSLDATIDSCERALLSAEYIRKEQA